MADIRVETRGAATHLVLDRPPLNILTTAMLAELAAALRDTSAQEGARVVVLRGEGKGFSAGVDVQEHLPETVAPLLAAFHGALEEILSSELPVVAAVHGPCLGGGMELAMAADLVYATDTATFGQPEIKLGVFPPFAAAAYPAWFGRARAAELVLLGEPMTARRAFERGLITAALPETDFEPAVDEVVRKLSALSRSSLRLARDALRLGAAGGPAVLEEVEGLYRDRLMRTEDAREGLRAFLEKRPPRWRGR